MSVPAQIPRRLGQSIGIQGFPGDFDQVVRLRNGASVHLRPIRPDDAPRLMALCQRLSLRTLFQRFFSPRRLRAEDAHALANVDYRERMALVAEVDTGQEPILIGVARYGPAGEAAVADIGLSLVVALFYQRVALRRELSVVELPLAERDERDAHDGDGDDAEQEEEIRRPTLRLLARYTHITQRAASSGITSITLRPRQNSAVGECAAAGDRPQ